MFDMNYCSQCGSGELSFEIPKGDNRSRFICQDCDTIHYSNPKMVTGCLPVWEDQVLLAKRSIAPRYGFWNIPSGYLENGETVEEGAVREVWEEAKAEVTGLQLKSVYSLPHINQIYIHFIGDLKDGAFGVGEESLEVQLFSEDNIPWEKLAFTSSVFTLQKYFADRKNGRQKVHLGQFVKPGKI
jgi:ADP-ribose pyrophosphatase YjhB (NUDIX family)